MEELEIRSSDAKEEYERFIMKKFLTAIIIVRGRKRIYFQLLERTKRYSFYA